MTFEGEFRFGFLALTDAAPLIAADRLGLFAAQGLKVALVREASWATARDRLAAGLLDGAHMLAQIAVAARLGLGGVQADLVAPMALNVHGAAITLSHALLERLEPGEMQTAVAIARLLQTQGAAPLTFGVVFAVSTHAYLLRDWLARAGIDPDTDVRLTVLPPTAMVERMRAGELDGFCVGAPWNAVAQAEGLGRIVAHSGELDPSGPDKVFSVGEAWAARNPAALQAALHALKLAALWCDQAANRKALVGMLAAPDALDAAPEAIALALSARELAERLIFAEGGVGRPNPGHAGRILSQMQRWGQVGGDIDPGRLSAIYRPDLFDRAG